MMIDAVALKISEKQLHGSDLFVLETERNRAFLFDIRKIRNRVLEALYVVCILQRTLVNVFYRLGPIVKKMQEGLTSWQYCEAYLLDGFVVKVLHINRATFQLLNQAPRDVAKAEVGGELLRVLRCGLEVHCEHVLMHVYFFVGLFEVVEHLRRLITLALPFEPLGNAFNSQGRPIKVEISELFFVEVELLHLIKFKLFKFLSSCIDQLLLALWIDDLDHVAADPAEADERFLWAVDIRHQILRHALDLLLSDHITYYEHLL